MLLQKAIQQTLTIKPGASRADFEQFERNSAYMSDFVKDFFGNCRAASRRAYLKQQTVPQARWQSPDAILKSRALRL